MVSIDMNRYSLVATPEPQKQRGRRKGRDYAEMEGMTPFGRKDDPASLRCAYVVLF